MAVQVRPPLPIVCQNIRAGSGPEAGRKAAATGLSERQREDAMRVASLDASEFDAAVESENPPTVTELSEAGRRVFAWRT